MRATDVAEPANPPRVPAAQASAAEAGFRQSRTPQAGGLLSLAAASKPGGTVGLLTVSQ